MSGAEVGLILGVLPLLVSAIEHFDIILGPLQRFKGYAPELSRFQRRLLAQKTIFRSQCQLLLVPLTGLGEANQMLELPDHEKWSEDLLKNRLEQQLQGSAEACVEIIRAIEDELNIIQRKAEEFSLWQSVSLPPKMIDLKSVYTILTVYSDRSYFKEGLAKSIERKIQI
jgi:hypothetical protein